MATTIGLVRHFKVQNPYPKEFLLDRNALISWFKDYDQSTAVIQHPMDMDEIPWQICYSSPMVRAQLTAKQCFTGDIKIIPALTELDLMEQLPHQIKLPFWIWAFLIRIKSKQPLPTVIKFRERLEDFLDTITQSEHQHVLVVAHWFVIETLSALLQERGFIGPKPNARKYGELYCYTSTTKNNTSTVIQ